jgi:hypothetical protein
MQKKSTLRPSRQAALFFLYHVGVHYTCMLLLLLVVALVCDRVCGGPVG